MVDQRSTFVAVAVVVGGGAVAIVDVVGGGVVSAVAVVTHYDETSVVVVAFAALAVTDEDGATVVGAAAFRSAWPSCCSFVIHLPSWLAAECCSS